MKYLFYVVLLFIVTACIWSDGYISSSPEYLRLFENTPCEQIAKAILRGDNSKIEQLIQNNRNLVNYKDSIWGETLLMYAVYFNRKDAVAILLKHGSNPNEYGDTINHRGDNAILIACRYDDIDIEILKMLLECGGDPESYYHGVEKDNLGNFYKIGSYAVQVASQNNLDKLKLLIGYGANVNKWSDQHAVCPVILATASEKMDILYYLLMHNADYNCINKIYKNTDTTEISLCELLRGCEFELGSKEHIYKMKAVKFLKERGVDYYSTPIPNYVIEDAKRKYPDSWQEYLQKY